MRRKNCLTGSETEIAHGAIPGALAVSHGSIVGNPAIDFSKKLVICCSRGKFSLETAQELTEKGYDAVSLSGGYTAWLLDYMQEEQSREITREVEQSIRKKFRKSIWCRFTKAINQFFRSVENVNLDTIVAYKSDGVKHSFLEEY